MRDENKFNIPFTLWHSIRDVYLHEFAGSIQPKLSLACTYTHRRRTTFSQPLTKPANWIINNKVWIRILCSRITSTLHRKNQNEIKKKKSIQNIKRAEGRRNANVTWVICLAVREIFLEYFRCSAVLLPQPSATNATVKYIGIEFMCLRFWCVLTFCRSVSSHSRGVRRTSKKKCEWIRKTHALN